MIALRVDSELSPVRPSKAPWTQASLLQLKAFASILKEIP